MNYLDGAMKALTAARKVLFFTGVGISAKSGIPTFRGKLTGVWKRHAPERLNGTGGEANVELAHVLTSAWHHTNVHILSKSYGS
ncbi:Sir2 family NAD-dependent protein deacetylase [Pseudomonas viridiflava]|uniref:Sir2 family NAD-dependent protein deacetylase n=1 Tax=Pseudomonas viridiflava TaxID=33069 RepID=UPI000F0527B4|nr:Sir2 family NAD-dependent protein deacetylase [Pseudomonas viridiflava]